MDKQRDVKIDLIESAFGTDYKRANNGQELRYDCPFCEEFRGKPDGDYKFYINVKSLVYNCFKCRASGKLRLDKKIQTLLKDITDVYEELIKFVNETSSDYFEDEEEQKLYKIPVRSALSRETAREYLIEDRGLTEQEIRFYNIRLGDMSNNFFGRVVIPNVVHKAIWTDMYVARTYVDKDPKYLNPNASKSGNAVFNLHNIDYNPDKIIITEGVFSSISSGNNGVCVYGKHVTNGQLKKIIDKSPDRIYVALDSDAEEESINLCDRIKTYYNKEIYRVVLPDGKDPNDLGKETFLNMLDDISIKFEGKVFHMLMGLDL